MARKTDFASKILKAQKGGPTCPVCESVYTYIQKVESYYSEETQSWKYKTQNLRVCKCNEKEVYG